MATPIIERGPADGREEPVTPQVAGAPSKRVQALVNCHKSGVRVEPEGRRTAWEAVDVPPAICGLPTLIEWPPDGGASSYPDESSIGTGSSNSWSDRDDRTRSAV